MGVLKIGLVLDDTLDTPDGVQQYVLTLGKWLSDQGHDVHYLVGHTERTDIRNIHSLGKNVRVQFNGNRMSTPLPASRRKIRKLLQAEQFDVLHVQIPYSPFLAARIIREAPSRTAVIGTFHIAPNSKLVTIANTVLGRLVQKSLRRFDTIVSVSPAAAAFAKATHRIDTPVVPNVVLAAHFAQAKPYPVSPGVRTVVFLGRLVPRKGCKILLEALNILKSAESSLPKLQVFICGKGPLDAELKAYAQDHGLSRMVTFTGFVDNDTKARYLKTADIAVFPSTGGESFGIVLIEAMAANAPVVLGADNDGYKTVLEPYPEVLFPVLDPAKLAAKLALFLADDAAHKKATEWQHRYVQQFDIAVVGPRLVARYNEALRSRMAA